MFSCLCASPSCQVNGCAQVRQLRQDPTITASPGALPRIPDLGDLKPKAIEYHPDGTVKRIEYH